MRIPVENRHTARVYAFAGSCVVGPAEQLLRAQHLAVFDRDGGDIVLTVPDDADTALGCVLLTGEPVNEPMVRYGPFVMNTAEELHQAVNDFNAGRMGSIPASGNA